MRLQELFDKGFDNHTYRRVSVEYQVNTYLGYNDNGQMSMVITEDSNEAPPDSSKLISVNMKLRVDGKYALSFDLLDVAYKSMFLMFCKDMILTCEKAGSEMAISSAIGRWKYWKEMFGKRKPNILDRMSIKGLIGELIELKDVFMPQYGQAKAVEAWMGPLRGHKDFEIDNTWYEVKSIAENAIQVKVSSLEQLESDVDGHLLVIRLEDTSTVNLNAINLNQIVSDIIDIISDPEVLDEFQSKLNSIGYNYDLEYDKYNYNFYGAEAYSVNCSFPRLRRCRLSEAIGNVEYTILLSNITLFRED